MARVREELDRFRSYVLAMPAEAPLGRQWQIAREHGLGILQVSELLKILIAEDMVRRKAGPYGGYFKR